MKKESIFLLVLLFSLAFSIPSANATQTSFVAVADSYVDISHPDANYGSNIYLYTHNHDATENNIGPIGTAWLKFDLSEIPSQAIVKSIILRMRTGLWGTRGINKVGVFVCEDNSWTESGESGITWTNAPSVSSSSPLQTLDVGDQDVDYDFNLTSTLTIKPVLTLVLKTVQPVKGPAVFDSKELHNGPTLIIDYDMPANLLNADFVVIGGIGLVVVVVVLGVFVFRRRRKGEIRKIGDSPLSVKP